MKAQINSTFIGIPLWNPIKPDSLSTSTKGKIDLQKHFELRTSRYYRIASETTSCSIATSDQKSYVGKYSETVRLRPLHVLSDLVLGRLPTQPFFHWDGASVNMKSCGQRSECSNNSTEAELTMFGYPPVLPVLTDYHLSSNRRRSP